MKKVLLIACSFMISSSMFAQNLIKDNSERLRDLGDWKETATKQQLRRDASEGWYLPLNWASAASSNSSNWQSFVSLVFPDSTVWAFGNRSETDPTVVRYGIGTHSWGQVFDPTDQNIQFGASNLDIYTQHQSYTWDSMLMQFGYVRQVDSIDNGSGNELIVDTLYIKYFSFSSAGIQVGGLNGGATYASMRSWNSGLGMPTADFRTDTLLLTNEDSTTRSANGWRSRGLVLPVGHSVPVASNNLNNRLIGFTTHFRPQVPYSAGDTLIDLTDQQSTTWTKKNNYFVNSYVVDRNPQSDQVPSVDHYNNSLICNKFTRYGTFNGFANGYIPGNAFFSNQYMRCGFYISTQNLSSKNLDAIGAKVGKLYPNPANNGNVTIPVTLKESADVVVTVTDVNGKTIYNNNVTLSGSQDISINVSDYAAGMYNVNVAINGIATTKKLMVK